MKRFDPKNEALNISLQLSICLRELQLVNRAVDSQEINRAQGNLTGVIKDIDTYIMNYGTRK